MQKKSESAVLHQFLVIDMAGVSSYVDGLRLHRSFIFGIAHLDEFAMIARVECDLLVLCQRLVDEHRNPIKISEWRHRSHFTIGEDVSKISLRCEEYLVRLQGSFCLFQTDVCVGRDDEHH
jgi:hypothetical protein